MVAQERNQRFSHDNLDEISIARISVRCKSRCWFYADCVANLKNAKPCRWATVNNTIVVFGGEKMDKKDQESQELNRRFVLGFAFLAPRVIVHCRKLSNEAKQYAWA